MVPVPKHSCNHANCSFEGENDATLTAHLAQSSSDGTRWECPGCKQKFCAFEAMDAESTHSNACIKLRNFVKKAKYGQMRLKIFCEWSQAEQDSGVRSGHNKKPSNRKQAVKAVTMPRRTGAGLGGKWSVNGANSTTTRLQLGERQKVTTSYGVDAGEDYDIEIGEGSGEEIEEEDFEQKEDDHEASSMQFAKRSTRSSVDKEDEQMTNSSRSPASKPPAEHWYGCSICDTVGQDLASAITHAEQSNEDMQRWNCHGCHSIFCEKAALIDHIETCPQFKEWMKNNDLLWQFRTNPALLNMTNESAMRGEGVLSTVIALKSFQVKAMKAKEATTKLYASQPIWNGESWESMLTIDPRIL